MQQETILSQYLKRLQVKFTTQFADKLYNEHPHKYNLYGLSNMLQRYHIKNTGVKITDKSKLSLFDPPFIAHFPDSFVLITKISLEKVYFWMDGRNVILEIKEFNKHWSGIVLFAEPDEKSEEPEYKKHFLLNIYDKSVRILLGILLSLLLFLFFYTNINKFQGGNSVLIGIYSIGLCITYFLMLKQIKIQSKYADKLCSLLKHNDCNNVLESDAAKIFGIISWSEVGLGYFISNLIIAVFAPLYMPYLALINICVLPYSVWSIWFQKYKAKQWCTLCVATQIILWLIAGANYAYGFIETPAFLWKDILFVGCVFLIPFLIIHLLLPYLSKGLKSENTLQELNSIKMKDTVFTTLLQEQRVCQTNDLKTKILFGNPSASLVITILTNPHCNPCAKMHKRINKLLQKAADKLCVQYFFSSFGPDFDESGLHLIGIYLNHTPDVVKNAYNEWFDTGRNQKEHYFLKYGIDITNVKITTEYHLHQDWAKKHHLSATPSILVNGYKLPSNYKLEDLLYFTDVSI